MTASPDAHGTVTWRIWQWLGRQSHPQPVKAIADALHLDETLTRKELNRGKRDWFINHGDATKGLWGALNRRQEAS